MATSSAAPSTLGRWYASLYDTVCGQHPNLRPWHFQWLDARPLYASLRRLLPTIGGGAERVVLDAGCGDKPYRAWFGEVRRYIGIDVYPGPEVDLVVAPDARWPFSDDEFDVILCAQVLEHVEFLQHTVSEIRRVLKPTGKALISVPFLYNEHGAPLDFRRFTVHGVRRLFDHMSIESVELQGGVGSTIVIIILNWWDQALAHCYPLRVFKALVMPLTIVMSAVLNVIGMLVDSMDRTRAFYSNVVLVVGKERQPTTAPSTQ